MTVPPIVYVVDDDPSFLKSLVRLLVAAGHNARGFDSAAGFLAQLDTKTPGCVIADLQMPGLNGLDLQAALRQSKNPMPVIFLTGQGDIPASVHAMRQGAEDFLTKLASKEEILNAVRRALERDADERLKRERLSKLRGLLESLSQREREVLNHVVRGELNKQIAATLAVNERTVKLHRTSITRKLGVHSVAELTRLCVEAGVLSTPTTG